MIPRLDAAGLVAAWEGWSRMHTREAPVWGGLYEEKAAERASLQASQGDRSQIPKGKM